MGYISIVYSILHTTYIMCNHTVCLGFGINENSFMLQAGSHIKELIEKCCLVKKGGEKVDDKMDSQMDFHFNAVLDIIADWRRNKEMLSDLNLLDKVRETHQHFMDESQINFTKEQETLLNFHIGNLEYACGTSLTNVSTLNWDQNEDYPQFSGKNALFVDGFGQILQKMVAAKDIIYNAEVINKFFY